MSKLQKYCFRSYDFLVYLFKHPYKTLRELRNRVFHKFKCGYLIEPASVQHPEISESKVLAFVKGKTVLDCGCVLCRLYRTKDCLKNISRRTEMKVLKGLVTRGIDHSVCYFFASVDIAVAANKGLQLASGEWIACLGDDEFSEDHLEVLINHAVNIF